MVTFSAEVPGTDPALWTAALHDVGAPTLELTHLRRLIVVAAHPDDETLGAGGLLAMATAAGIRVDVLVATDGEASHPASPTHPPAALAAIRRGEVAAALGVVAPGATMTLLHLPDGRLADHVDAAAAALRVLLDTNPQTPALVVAPWPDDRHPDHRAAGTFALAATEDRPGTVARYYPIWAWHWGTPDAGDVPMDRLSTLPLTAAALAAKRRALAMHVSQTTSLSDAAGDERLLPVTLTAFFDGDTEYFLAPAAAGSRPPPSTSPVEPPPPDASLDRDFFDAFYGDDDDPWHFETRWYEKRKRDLTLASLPRRRFRSAFEPGCATGLLTERLADRCDAVLAADISARPLVVARRRLGDSTHVTFRQLRVPHQWPAGDFDLVVLSEVGYYCDSDDLDRLIDAAVAALDPDGVLVACHWRHPVEEYPLGGDDVHARLHARSDIGVLATHLENDFRLDVFVRPPAVSVAARDGLVG